MSPMFVELNFPIEDGMPALPGVLPEARIEAILDHDASRPRYDGKAEFLLGKVELAGNTGTFLDAPFHRHRHAPDLAQIALARVAGLPGVVVDAPDAAGPVDIPLSPREVRGRAVLVRTGWDARWRSDAYWEPGPHLSGAGVDLLLEGGAALVGVDFTNVDDTGDPARPAHTRLLEGGVLLVEHLTGLAVLPRTGFRFFAVPLRIVGGASFPVRAFAELPD